MSTALAAQEIGAAWLEYVTSMFELGEEGCGRADVQEEYQRLESAHTFTRDRQLWRGHTDILIEKILQSSPEARLKLISATDARSLAFVQDRIQCGSELLTALIQKGLQINVGESTSLPDFFRQILLQRQA